MRHYDTLRDITDAMGLYETARETATIGDHVRHYETVRDAMILPEILWDIMRHHETS